jgi:hypothetical protein
MTYFCTKCGYSGEQAGEHLKYKGSGKVCHYEPMPLPPMTDEERKRICEQFGIDVPAER